MADDLAPPQIRNGGAGSVETSNNSAPQMPWQSSIGIRTDLPDNNAHMRAEALSQSFKEFEGVSYDYAGQAQTQAGALAGAASGATGHPQYKQGLARFSAYSAAFNNAATGAYAAEAEAEADDSAARLRVQANNNPATFAATYSAARDAVLKSAPPMAVPMLTELYNKRLAQGLAAVSTDQLTEQKKDQRQAYDLTIQRGTSAVANLQGSDNPQDHLEAADEWTKLSAKINGGVASGLYSEAEAQAMLINAHREITAQVFSTQVDRELSRPDGHVDLLLNNFRQAHLDNLSNPNEPPILAESEFQQLMQNATTKVREYRLMQEMEKVQGSAAERAKFEAGDQQYTSMFFGGNLTIKALDDGVRNNDLRPETARTLYNYLQSNAANGKGNTNLYFKLHNDPNFLDMKPADVARYVGPGGLNGKQADELAQDADKRRNSWEGTQQVKQGKESIAAALKIPSGDRELAALDETTRKAYTDTVQDYLQILNSTDPAKITQSAAGAAQTAIAHAHQREAAAQVIQLQQDLKATTASHGPASGVPWSKDKMDAYVKDKQAALTRAQAAAKGP